MKRLSVILLSVVSILCITSPQVESISVSDFTPILDKKIAKMESTQEKVEYLQSFLASINSSKYTKSNDAWLYKGIEKYVQNMLNVFEHELRQEWTKSTTNNQTPSNQTEVYTEFSSKIGNLPTLSDNISNVDVQKVREAILSWHNTERASLWRSAYKYSIDLEWSATIRAKNLANSGKTKNLHARKAWDWYYNYNSMTNRFSSLWINFWNIPKWATAFSETVWRNVYRCNKADCTDELITAIKKTWTWLIMKEKSSNWSHYRSATMNHFTQMWAWIAIDKNHNRYYVVLHYGVD